MNVDLEGQRRRVVERRKAIGLTQREVAELGALSQASLSRIEQGEKVASVPELLGIAYATGSTVGYLTGQSPVLQRAQVAARAETAVDTSAVQDRLRYLLEMDELLDRALAGENDHDR